MKRELRVGVAAVRRRPALLLAAWSVPEILPTACYGLAVAHATDAFLAGRTERGLAWLGGLVAAALFGALGARFVYRLLGDLVEPLRDELVRKVVAGALRNAQADGALARLNRQVEIVRDTFAGLVLVDYVAGHIPQEITTQILSKSDQTDGNAPRRIESL